MSRVNPGRLAAARTLIAVERGGHAEDLLAELAPPPSGERGGADRALAWHLALGVLRRQGSLDAVLGEVAGRDVGKLDPGVRAALRLGLFEAALSRTPPHAAVDQAVGLARQLGMARAAGFVNAVLRKAVTRPLPDDPARDLPPWLAERFVGFDAWIERLQRPAPLAVATRDGAPPAGLTVRPAAAAGETVPGVFWVEAEGRPGAAGGRPVETWPGFAGAGGRPGAWWVMDPAAAAVAALCLSALGLPPEGDPAAGKRVLDACAAPGGKSFYLAARGADVVATDVDPGRLALVGSGAARLQLPVAAQVHDWLSGPLPESPGFDAVLVDAPCTGLGTLRRHPEIRWRRLPTDPAAMALRQRAILRNAARGVADGGALVYAVCSPLPEEGAAVAESLAGWRVERAWSSVPPAGDEDAFQAFVLRRGP